MDERDWLILKTLHEKKSITKTAAALFISQPALSGILQQIESRFGTTIVVRSKKGVQFTPEGEYLVKGSYEMLKKIRAFEENIQNMREVPTGTLRIGASATFTQYLLPELLRRFREQYPGVKFKVTTDWSRDIVNLAYNNAIHIGFIRGDFNWPGEKTLLFEEKICICHKNKISLDDLPQIPKITYRNDYSVQVLLDEWWSENYSVPPQIDIEVDRVDTCKEMVVKGLGYAFLPGMVLADNKELWTHEMLYVSGKPLLRRTWMLYHNKTMELKLAEIFLDFIQKTDFNALLN